MFYRGGGGAEGTKTHEKLILLEADLANHGRVSRDLTDEEIPGDVDGGSARGAGPACLGKNATSGLFQFFFIFLSTNTPDAEHMA